MTDLEALISRIDRQQEEFRRFAAEQHKLMAERAKPGPDRFFPPWLMITGLIGSIIGLVGGIVGFASAIATFPQ